MIGGRRLDDRRGRRRLALRRARRAPASRSGSFHAQRRRRSTARSSVTGDMVYAAHSEENVDGRASWAGWWRSTARARGDITKTGELWRADGIAVGFAAPTVADGPRLRASTTSANLHALDEKTGKPLWTCRPRDDRPRPRPVCADGKLYATEVNGNVLHRAAAAPPPRKILDDEDLTMPEGRFAEIWGSLAVAYGRLYFMTEDGLYCVGAEGRARSGPCDGKPPALGRNAAAARPTRRSARLLVVPAEVIGEGRRAGDVRGLGLRRARAASSARRRRRGASRALPARSRPTGGSSHTRGEHDGGQGQGHARRPVGHHAGRASSARCPGPSTSRAGRCRATGSAPARASR